MGITVAHTLWQVNAVLRIPDFELCRTVLKTTVTVTTSWLYSNNVVRLGNNIIVCDKRQYN